MIKNKIAKETLAIILIFGLMIIGVMVYLSSFGGGVGEESSNLEYSYTETKDIITNQDTGEITLTLYSSPVNIPNINGTYKPFTEVVDFSFVNNELELSWNDKKVVLEPYVIIMGNNDCSFADGYGSLNADIQIANQEKNYKYNISFSNTPTNLTNFGFRLKTSSNISTFTSDGKAFVIDNLIRMDFSDMNEFNYTNTSSRIVFGNVSSNVVAGSLEIDPTISLQTADEHNLADEDTDEDNPNTNTGTATLHALMGEGTAAGGYRPYFMFDISGIPSSATSSLSELSLYVTSNTDHNVYYIHHVKSHSWEAASNGSVQTETTLTWNTQPCGTGFDNSTFCNLTSEDNSDVTTTGWVNWTVLNMINNEISNADKNVSFMLINQTGEGDVTEIASKEYTTDTTKRPKLTLSYTLGDATPTSCGFVNASGLTLTSDISHDYGDCLTINASDVVVDCNSFNITTGSGGNGVRNNGFDNVTVKNCEITTSGTWGYGIYYYGINSGTIYNNTIVTFGNNANGLLCINSSYINVTKYTSTLNDALGINLKNSSHNIFDDIVIKCTRDWQYGIKIDTSKNNSFNNGNIQYNGGGLASALYSISSNSTFSNFVLNSSLGSDMKLYTAGITNLTNSTFNESDTSFSNSAILNVHWYTDVYANDSNGNALENVAINITNKDGDNVYTGLTNASGRIARQEILDYWQNKSAKFTQNNHTINGTLSGYSSDQESVNISTNKIGASEIVLTLAAQGPTTTLVSPADQTNSTTSSNTFTCNVTSVEDLSNITLYIWNGSTITNTTSVSGTSNQTSFIHSLSDDSYTWNCRGVDDQSNSDWADSNWSLGVDATYPIIYIDHPTNTTYTTTSITLNYTITETNEDSCWFKNGTSTNITIASCLNTTFTASQGSTNLTLYANDTYGNENLTSVVFFVDSIHPSITITNPTNATHNTSTLDFNVTVGEITSTCQYSLGGNANVSLTDLGSNKWGKEVTTIPEGGNYVIYSCNDTSDNWNSSETRYFIVDITYPTYSIDSPTLTNNSYTTTNYIEVNVSVTETYLKNLTIILSNASKVKINSLVTYTNGSSYKKFNSLSDGIYYWNASMWDYAENRNDTPYRIITVDTTEPVPQFTNPTNATSTYNKNDYIEVNITLTETNHANITYKLHNSSGVINTTILTSGYYLNFEGLDNGVTSPGKYEYNGTAKDKAGNTNSTETRTIYLDNYPPAYVNFTSPTPNNNTELNARTFDINVSFIERYGNYFTLNFNGTKTNYSYTADSGSLTENSTLIKENNVANGNYFYNITFFDHSANSNSTETRHILINASVPVIVLGSPATASYTNVSLQTFFCNITGVGGNSISNVTFYLWDSSDTETNTSFEDTSGNTSVNLNFTYSLSADDIYKWNCKAIDNQSNSGFSTSNHTLTYDTTFPLISYHSSSTSAGTYTDQNAIFLNISITETNINTIYYYWNDVESTFTTNYYINKTSLTDQNYTYYAWVNDSVNNENKTLNRTVCIDYDGPEVTISSPANGSTETTGTLPYTVSMTYSISDSVSMSYCRYNVTDSTGGVEVAETSLNCSGTSTSFSVNSAGTYTITLAANSSTNRLNFTRNSFTITHTVGEPVGGAPFAIVEEENVTEELIGYCEDGFCDRLGERGIPESFWGGEKVLTSRGELTAIACSKDCPVEFKVNWKSCIDCIFKKKDCGDCRWLFFFISILLMSLIIGFIIILLLKQGKKVKKARRKTKVVLFDLSRFKKRRRR